MSISVRDGNWSDPMTWDVMPTRADDVTIQHAVEVDAPAEARLVTLPKLQGVLTVASTLELWGSLVVNGILFGSVGEIRFHVADDRLFTGNLKPTDVGYDPMDFYPNDIGLWGMGEVQLSGPEVTPWLNAVPRSSIPSSSKYGADFFNTINGTVAVFEQAPVGWQPGDTLVICAIDGGYSIVTLQAIQAVDGGKTIQFSDPVHADTLAIADASGVMRFAYPKVANLSRRFVISSADVAEGDTHHRAHVAMMHGGCAELDYVELRNLGPRGKLGRYPAHFHKMGDPGASACCRLNGCSVWQSVSEPGSRFVSVHSSSQVQVTNNVGLLSRGHGFFSEAGDETLNTWQGNLSIDVSGPEELPVANTPQILDVQSNHVTPTGSHHFWLYSGSTIGGNVCVGPKTVPGVVIPAPSSTVGMLVQAYRGKLTAASLPPPVVDGLECLGSGQYGFWSTVQDTVVNNSIGAYLGVAFNHETGFPDPRAAWNDPLWAFCGVGGTHPYRSCFYMNSGNISDHLQVVTGGVLVGDILLHAHYHAVANFQGVKFAGTHLVGPTYWQCALKLTDCVFAVDLFEFHAGYLPHQEEPGIVRVVNGSGNLAGHAWPPGPGGVSDFTILENARFPGFSGTPQGPTALALTAPAPRTGTLTRPVVSALPDLRLWNVYQAGTKPPIFRLGNAVDKTLQGWALSVANGMDGYPYGFPPGVYDSQIKMADGTTQQHVGQAVAPDRTTSMV